MSSIVRFRVSSCDEILALREQVLIEGTDRSDAAFDGDFDIETVHFGAFIEDENIACASCMRSDREGRPAWQLRGMATHAEHRDVGVGRQLLAFIEQHFRSSADMLWCNARTGAVSFYERSAWECTGDVFDIAGVGPHREMRKKLRLA